MKGGEKDMTLRQNKVAIHLGNFVYHGDDYGIVIKRDETIVGDIYTFLNLSSGDIMLLREHQLTPYTRRKNGTTPSENMSDRQRQAISLIEQNLQINWNGRTMEDVSTFIGLFKETSIGVTRKAHQRSYDQYAGLDGFDVFHR